MAEGGHELDLLVEADRGVAPNGCLGDDQVDLPIPRRLLVGADRLTPKLGYCDIEIGQIVGVEDDPLRVAVRVADPKSVAERAAQRVTVSTGIPSGVCTPAALTSETTATACSPGPSSGSRSAPRECQELAPMWWW